MLVLGGFFVILIVQGAICGNLNEVRAGKLEKKLKFFLTFGKFIFKNF